MILIYIVAYMTSFFGVATLLRKNRIHKSDYYIAALLFMLSLHMVVIALGTTDVDLSFSFLHCVMLYLYFYSITKSPAFKPVMLLNFVPFVVSLLMALFWPSLFDKCKLTIAIILPIWVLVYFWQCFKLLNDYKRFMNSNFSTVDVADMSWLYLLIYGTLACYVVGALALLLHLTMGTPLKPEYFALVLLLFVTIAGLRGMQPILVFIKRTVPEISQENDMNGYITPSLDGSKPESYANYGLKDDEAQQLAQRLKDYMEKEKPYINPDLSLKDLAGALKVYPHYITLVLNTIFNQNFYDLVNTYRVDEAKKQLKDPQKSQYTVISIAFDCGFNSKSTFNRIFKQKTGVTPSEFRDIP